MRRRNLLSGCGIVLAGLLAGCGGGGSGGDGGSGSDGGSEETPSPNGGAETPMATPTAEMETSTPEMETETPAPTPTQTPETSGTTHELGEEFTVGEGSNALSYRIIELFRTDRIGSSVNNTSADGTFLIVVLEVTNPQNTETSFPRPVFRLQTTNSWQRFDEEGTQRINADERLNVNQVGDATINAGNSVTGAVAFDVDPDGSYRIWITPIGAEEPEHFVPVGQVSSVQELQGSLTG